MGKHLSSILAVRRKQNIGVLPSPMTAWKNQPPSMKKSLQQSLLRRKICHPYFPSSWRWGQRCEYAKRRDTVRTELRKWDKEEKIRGETKRKMEHFGWVGLREDREPGAVLQDEVKHFHKSVLVKFTCSGGRLKSRHAWLGERPMLSTGAHLCCRKTCASSLHFPHRAVCSITIPRADAGKMSSFPLHSQAECPKIQRREKHNKFRLPS